MPDIPSNTYDRGLDFLDQGYANLRDINYNAPQPQSPFSIPSQLETTQIDPKAALDNIFATLKSDVMRKDSFLNSIGINRPIRTPLAQTERYASKTYGFDPLNPNIEQQYGDRQTTFETWKNYILKFGANTAGAFLQNLVTLPLIAEGIVKGDMSVVYNNPTTNGIQDWMERLETTIPTYQTTAQKNNPVASWIPFAPGSAHNWGMLLQNLGFTAGSIFGSLVTNSAVGAVVSGIGAPQMINPQMMKAFGLLGKYYTGEKAAVTTLAQGLQRGDKLIDVINNSAKTIKIVDRFRYGLAIGTSAFAEGAFEANQTARNIQEILTEEFRKKHGYDPKGEDLKQIEEYALGGGNADLFGNVALLSLTNSAVFGSLFKPFNTAKKSIQSAIMSDKDIVLKGMDVFEKAVKPSGMFSLMKSTVTGVTRPIRTSLIEGFEEGAQFAMSRSAEDYYKRKFNDDTISNVDNFYKSLSTGIKDTLTTREGLENVFMGILSGTVIHGGRKVLERKRGLNENRNRLIDSTLTILNNQKLSGLFSNTYNEAVTAQSIADDMQKALEKDDIFEYKNLQFQQLFNFIESGVRANRFDLRIDQLEMLKDLKPEEFQQMFNIDFSEESKKTVDAYVDSVISKAYGIKENIDKINRVFKNPYEKNSRNHLIFNEYKTQLALDLSEIDDNRRRLNQIKNDITRVSPLVDIQDLMNLTNDKGLSHIIIDFQKRVDTLSDSLELLEDKESDFYKDQAAERSYLQKKIVDLKEALEEFDPVEYQKHAHDIITYFANGKSVKKDNLINLLDAKELLVKGQDAFKLISASDRALYHYQKLIGKEGFEENWEDLVKEYDIQEDKAEKTDILGEQEGPVKESEKVKEPIEDIEEIDENGNPVNEAEKRDAAKEPKPSPTPAGPTQAAPVQGGPIPPTRPNVDITPTREEAPKKEILPEGFVDSSTPVPTLPFEQEDEIKEGKKEAEDKKEGVVKNKLGFNTSNPEVFYNKLYSKNYKDGNQEKDNLREAVFSQTPEQFVSTITMSMKESTQGQEYGKYNLFKPFKNIFYQGYKIDMELMSGGKVIGKIQPANRLAFKKGQEMIPLYDITIEDYAEVTGNDPASFEDFKKAALAYKTITDKFEKDFQNGKREYTNAELTDSIDFIVKYGGIVFRKSIASATLLKDIEYKGKGSAILSFPRVYNKETKTFERSTQPTILNKKELTPDEVTDVVNYLKENINDIVGLNRRYIYLMKMPDGRFHKFSTITARPAKATKETLGDIFKEINISASQRYRTNVARVNEDLKEKIYITDSRNADRLKSRMYFSISATGDLYLNVFNTVFEYRKRLKITEAKQANNFDEMLDLINQKLALLASKDPDLDRLNIKLEKNDFSVGILGDESVSVDQLENSLTVSVPKEVFNDFSVSLFPKEAGVKAQPSAPKTPVQPTPAQPTGNTVAFTITRQVRQQLYDLNYSKEDVDKMTPKEAQVIIADQRFKPKESLVKLDETEQKIYDSIIANLNDIKGDYRKGIEVMMEDPLVHKDIVSHVVSQFINNWETGRSTFGDKISDTITKLVPEAAKAENEQIKSLQLTKDRKGLVGIFKSLFGLKSKQAAAVADIYDRTAQAWANRNDSTKEEFYKRLYFQKVDQDYQFGDDVLTQLEEDPLVRELFRRKTFEPIGRVSVERLARERFNIDQLKEKNRLIGEGSDRDVYDIGDGKVVKIAKTARGLLQNDTESDIILSESNMVPKVLEVGTNYIVVEKVEPADIYDYDIAEVDGKWFVVGTSQVSYLVDPDDQKFIEVRSKKDAIKKKQELQNNNIPRKFIEEYKNAKTDQAKKQVLSKYGLNGDVLESYDILKGDFLAIQNWGIKNGRPIHLDGGTFDRSIFEDTEDRKIAEEDFKEIRRKTNELAIKFRDSDFVNKKFTSQYPLYQSPILSNSAMIANVVKGFGLVRSEGFNLAFKTKTGTATPNLANKINKWLADNGYGNTIKFVYEGTYGTVNPFINEGNILFQSIDEKLFILNQQAKGAIRLMDDGHAIIYALTNPDVSTPLHELAHFWEGQLTDIERDEVLEWAGLGEEWTREVSEKFARGFERYLSEGEAPNSALQSIFDNFKKWLKEIYKVIIGNQYFADVELNDSMRKIYAAMLGENFEEQLEKETKQEQKTEEETGFQALPIVKAKQKEIADSLGEMLSRVDEEEYGKLLSEGTLEQLQEKLAGVNIEIDAGVDDPMLMVRKTALENRIAELEGFTGEEAETDFVPNIFTIDDIGSKVLYKGKEVTVIDIFDLGEGRAKILIDDGTKYGQLYVQPNELQKIDPVTEEVVPTVEETKVDEGLLKDVVAVDYVGEEAVTETDEDMENLDLAQDYVGLKLILENLKLRFNIPYSVVASDEDWKGKFENGVAVININRVTRDTPFHEYLHPFIAVMKVDNPALYQNLMQEFDALLLDNDDLAGESIDEVTKSGYYRNKTRDEQKEEALIRSISKLAARNINKEAKTLRSQVNRAWKTLMSKIREWLDYVMQGLRYDPEEIERRRKVKPSAADFRNKMTKAGYVKDISRAGIGDIRSLPEYLNAQDIADILSLHSVSFDMSNHMNLIKKLNEFQADVVEKSEEAKIIDRIKRKLAVLEDTARRRTPSDILMSEMVAIKGILKNKDEIDSINNYVQRGLNGLDFANDEFKRLSTKLSEKNESGEKFTKQEIRDLNQSLSLIKNLLAFYDDVSILFSRITEDMDAKDYAYYSKILNQANNNTKYIKTRSVELVAEWLYPYIEEFNEKIKNRYPEYVLSKKEFKNKIYTADSDSNLLFYWLGSISSSSDPVAGVVRTALFDVIEDNHLFEAELGEEIKLIYNEFLNKTGLKNEIKQTEEYYKNNYLRKATVLERTEEKDANDKFIYRYKQKWAFHEEFFYDLYVKEKDEFLEKLTKQYEGEVRPEEGTPEYQDFVDKIFAWEETNGSLSKPAERFRNPMFKDLYEKDKLFKKLYDTYKAANSKLGEHEELKYGVVPQVSRGRLNFSEIKKPTGVVPVLKEIKSGIVNFVLPRVENDTTTSDTQENLDGTIYRKRVVPFTHHLDEDDVSLILPETVFKYAGTSNLTSLMREVEPNVDTLKSLLEGNSRFINEARKINKVTSDRKPIFDHILKLPAKKDKKIERLNKQLSTWIDDVVYGITELQSEINIGKKKVDLNKLGGNLAFLTALNNMAANITAGISNVSIGNILSFGEALGGRYWTKEDWSKAQGQYFGNFKEFMKDAFSLKKSKITQLGIKYDAIQGEFRDKYGKKFVGNATQRYATSDTFFIINHAAEHQIQLIGMLSLMNATKVKTKKGETVSLYDAHTINDQGYLRLREDVEWTQEQNREFTRRLHGLNKMLNGNYSKFDKVHLQRTWFGKLLLIYRKFIYNGFRSRYGSKRPDYEIGDVMEGYYRKFFTKLWSDIKTYKFDAARKAYSKEGWSDDEKYAATKTLYELSMFMATLFVTLAISAADEDDEKSWGQNYLALMMMRVRSDIGTYSIFGTTNVMNIIQNPSAVILTLKRYMDVISQIIKNPFETYDRKTGAFAKGDSILEAKILKALPLVRQFINLLQPEEQKKFFKLLNRY